MTKFELVLLALVGAVCVAVGWTDDGGWAHRLALLWGGINLGVVMVFALDERVGGDDE